MPSTVATVSRTSAITCARRSSSESDRSSSRKDGASTLSSAGTRDAGDLVQRPLQVAGLARASLDFSTGGLRDLTDRDEHQRVHLRVVLIGDGLADGAGHGIAGIGTIVALDFVHHDEPFHAVDVQGKRDPRSRSEHRMAGFHRPLDVLRVQIAPAQDDEILQATGDEEVSLVEEPQIAGSQKRALLATSPMSARRAPKVCAVSSG